MRNFYLNKREETDYYIVTNTIKKSKNEWKRFLYKKFNQIIKILITGNKVAVLIYIWLKYIHLVKYLWTMPEI